MSEDPRTVHLSKEEREGLGQSGYEPVAMSQSFVRLDEDMKRNERLHIDYAICGLDRTRKDILMRRAFTILAGEECRLYSLTDAQAIAELDTLKATQDKQFLRYIAQETNPS